jgi:hypothetical protein
MDMTAYDRFAGLTDTTFHELSEKRGIPMDLLRVVHGAVGFGEPRPGDRFPPERPGNAEGS